MKKWKLSKYTVIVRDESGDVFFHNSFMGSVAAIPASIFPEINRYLDKEITDEDFSNASLKELCRNGFFFPTHIDEQNFVNEVLDKESRSDHFELIILPHENCNFRCTYCYESHHGGIMNRDVVEGLKRFVEDKAKHCKSLTVSWFGGEPLLAKDIIFELSKSFMNSCEKNMIPYRGHITTNGYLLTPDVVEDLIKYNVRLYQVTVDGHKDIHNTTRHLAGGGDTFSTIIDNLVAMGKRNDDFSVSIRVNFNNNSLPLMDNFFKMLSKSFGNDPRFGVYFRPIGKYGGPNDVNIEICNPDCAKLIEVDLVAEYTKYGYLDRIIRESLGPNGLVCYAGKESSLVIGAEGTIYKCSVVFDDPNNHIGKILPDGTLKIDRSRWDLWVSNKQVDTKGCTSCPMTPLCRGKYCPSYAIKERKPMCPMTPEVYARMIQVVATNGRKGVLL